MLEMTIKEVIEATGGKLLKGSLNAKFKDVERDSRVSCTDKLFVALVGENFDGNDFAETAVKNGASGILVSREMDVNTNVILVEDTKTALGQIATYYRNRFTIPFVGITGSVGKTTTKDMIACVLSYKFSVLSTSGNFNNEIGLPLTLLKLNNEHEIGVTEMGMSGFGEIDRLSKMVHPKCAVFTNIGLSHVEKLGSRENILKAKAEMLNNLEEDGYVVLSGDDDMLITLKENLKNCIYYGIENKECEVFAGNIKQTDKNQTSFLVNYKGEKLEMTIPVLGEHNVKNALAAICVAKYFGLSLIDVKNALLNFVPGNMRQNIIELNGITVINDCYNASPTSVQAGLKILNQIDSNGRKIAILGDMLEMGDLSDEAHKTVGEYVVENKVDFLITIGEKSKKIVEGAFKKGFNQNNTRCFLTNKEAIDFIDGFLQKNDIVLVKASRGMKLEEIVEHIIEF